MEELNLTPSPLNKNNIWGYLKLWGKILEDVDKELSTRIKKLIASGVRYRKYMMDKLDAIQEEIDYGRYS